MSNELMTIFSNEPKVLNEDLVSLKIGYKKRTGEKIAKAVTADGRTFIKSLSPSGVTEESLVTIPNYSSKEERNKIIQDLSNKYVQDDIADMLDISQGTVCNVLKSMK
ncbi:MAG: hypothetical protein CVU95_01340 [Firmicutes bacterium HGW-Firmicutes-2]|jgi:hypothetical protein|nr:MAG: hypothetical protein CVU95_01340 [Firmicutes bacterium HGW-Firmicutes-2]